MINFDDYKNLLLKITFKDPEQSDPLFCLMSYPIGISAASIRQRLDPFMRTFIKFADEAHLRRDDFTNSESILLNADDIASIEILKPE